ncbi:hypothetical protein AGMMS49593_00740 [Endomicrobiia bacterium]|nr:hypothetical protein AGMMS49593_00740 [Endomicrobiia bacterium]GHT45199.1 hypothetical protein AGMMS49936_02050 [Endomicrobiia bacterium]
MKANEKKSKEFHKDDEDIKTSKKEKTNWTVELKKMYNDTRYRYKTQSKSVRKALKTHDFYDFCGFLCLLC